jgi:hypothetical protein
MDAGEIEPLPIEILLASLIGPAQEFLRLWFSGRADLGLRQARELLAEAAWRSVRPD